MVGFSLVDDSDGRLDIRLYLRDERVALVDIYSRRLLDAPKLFLNQPIGVVQERLPLLYSHGTQAHGVAAGRAIEKALGASQPPGLERARDLMLHAEMAREQLRRLFGRWPSLLGERRWPAASPVASIVRTSPNGGRVKRFARTRARAPSRAPRGDRPRRSTYQIAATVLATALTPAT